MITRFNQFEESILKLGLSDRVSQKSLKRRRDLPLHQVPFTNSPCNNPRADLDIKIDVWREF